jgi:N-acetylmuramoyl-L-alanine amidase
VAECILKYLKTGTPQKNRGIIESNFHMLREAKMPAILSENGFMDNKREAMLMINKAFQNEVAREICQGICNYFGVKYISCSDILVMQGRVEFYERKIKELKEEAKQKVLDNCRKLF